MSIFETVSETLSGWQTGLGEVYGSVKEQISKSSEDLSKMAAGVLTEHAAVTQPFATAAGSFLIVKSAVDLSHSRDNRSSLAALAKITGSLAAIYLTHSHGDSNRALNLATALAASTLSAVLYANSYKLVIQIPQGKTIVRVEV